MAVVASGNLSVSLTSHSVKGIDLSAAGNVADILLSIEQALANGTGSGYMQQVFADARTLGDGANETIDLQALTNPHGDAVLSINVKVIAIKNRSATQTLTVGNAAATQFTAWCGAAAHTRTIPPLGWEIWGAAGGGTVDGTHKDIKVLNSAGAGCDYDIVVLACTS